MLVKWLCQILNFGTRGPQKVKKQSSGISDILKSKIQVRVFFSIRKISRIQASSWILKILTFCWFQLLYLSMFWKQQLNSKRGSITLIQYLSMKLNFKSKKFLTLVEKTLFFDLLSPLALPKFKSWQIHLTSIYFHAKNY